MSLSLKISWWKTEEIWLESHPYGLQGFIGYQHLNEIIPMGKACPTPLTGIKFPSLSSIDIHPFYRHWKNLESFKCSLPSYIWFVKVLKIMRWKGHMNRLTNGLYKTVSLKIRLWKRHMRRESALLSLPSLQRRVLPSQQGCRVPESNSGTVVGGKGRKEQMKRSQ